MEIIIKTDNSELLICKHKSVQLTLKCIDEVEYLLYEKPEIKFFGKVCYQQRNVGFFSDIVTGYKYSGQIMEAQPLTDNLRKLLIRVEKLCDVKFNAILVNEYEDGANYIGAHSDDVRSLEHCTIACISSSIRTFRIRDKNTKRIECDVDTIPTHLLVMNGGFQKEFTHEIPINKHKNDSRYSFTFRCHKE